MTHQNTFELAKAFLDLENARKRFEMITLDNINPEAKRRLKGYAKRLEWVIQDMKTSLPRQSAEIFSKQVCTWETLSFSAVMDEMLMMDEQQREGFELIAKARRKREFEVEEAKELEAA
jgi:hypothetical protein